ncbi:glycosyl hydrolase [Streptomyces armeniacus]|uniref:Glycosyl hydrolase n=1 Tax=Streptomyces armeniacus TaxID=83291 RepID=A0A345XI40_9ACTN|nr:glycosyl hydrolase [Streptomyces armeniacus]
MTPQRRRPRLLNPRTRRARLAVLGSTLALTASGYALVNTAQADESAAATTAQVWITTADGSQKLARADDAAFDGSPQSIDIQVDAGEQGRQFTGAGASMTGASARLISQLPADARDSLLNDLFSGEGEGIGLDYVRQPLGGSDFVAELPYYTYEDTQGEFSIAKAQEEIIPLLEQARGINSGIRFMGSPWSPPAWMKDGGKLEGGKLSPDHYGDYADYLVRTVQAYADAGVPLTDLTVQNEPLFETTYPSTDMSAAEQADFFRVLDEKLTAAGLDTNLFAYDHNWDKPEYPLEVLDKTADIERVRGAAFHCYGGQPEAQQQVADTGKSVFFTECSGTDSDNPANTFADTLKWQTENLVIRSLRSGSETVVVWNLALDQNGGPHFGNCQNRCNGVVEINGGNVTKNAEFYALGHVSRFVDRGAHRIGSTTQEPGGLQNVTYENPDGSRASVVLNATGSSQTFSITENGKSLSYELPAGAVSTFTWPEAPTG